MAAQNLLSSSKLHDNHHVFLSFINKDARMNIIDHVNRAIIEEIDLALNKKGIRTFLSEGGNDFSAKQRQAMHQSGINAVVFSKEYCSSLEHGHLDELVEMAHLKNTRGTPLIPIFYDIDPDDVRNQTGPFAEVFDMHENKSQVDCEKVRQWRKALANAADSPRWVFRSAEHGDPTNFVEDIVDEISFMWVSLNAVSSFRSYMNSWTYDVFLSYILDGIHKNFGDRLYSSLVRNGVCTFLDDDNLAGENISTKVLNAIRRSRISIVIFSEGYGSSKCSLDKLMEIQDLQKNGDHIFLPIFYRINPLEVRNQTGAFAEAFTRHEERLKMEMDRVQRWRAALSEAADCTDWIVESVAEGDTESKLISDIVGEVMFTCSFPKAFETLPPFWKPCSNCWNHDVFLSFRGKDTRKTFTDHLNSALVRDGISTFLADDELTRGENICTGLFNAIWGSSSSIVVFSKGYASSKWCLDEIAEIMQCVETKVQSFLPIFLDVSPSDVRNQTGAFAKAFDRHEKKFEEERVKRWRAALTNAGYRAGFCLTNNANGYESKLIKMIVEKVLSNVIHGGMDSRVKKLRGLLNLGTPKVCIVGICGIGGIGKTTLAEAVFNQLCDSFEGSSFLRNIQGVSEQPHGFVHLQKLLLYNILKTKNLEIVNEYEGITLIKKSLHGKRVLIVLDNVDCMQQVHLLAGNRKWLGLGSRIIVTTRNEQLLTQLGVDEKMKVEELDYWESNELFSWHSFEGNINESKDHSELSIIAAECIGGVPLALKLFGSFLRGRSIGEWEMKLDELRRITASIEQQALAPHIHKEKKRKITLADECQR